MDSSGRATLRGMSRPVLAVLALPLVLTGCGGGSTSDISTGCFTISQAVETYNSNIDAVRAGTATDGDIVKAYGKMADKLGVAANLVPTGKLHDLASSAATAAGRVRVAVTGGQVDPVDVRAVDDALQAAQPLCKGK